MSPALKGFLKLLNFYIVFYRLKFLGTLLIIMNEAFKISYCISLYFEKLLIKLVKEDFSFVAFPLRSLNYITYANLKFLTKENILK